MQDHLPGHPPMMITDLGIHTSKGPLPFPPPPSSLYAMVCHNSEYIHNCGINIVRCRVYE